MDEKLKYLEIYDAIEPYISIENYNLILENGESVEVLTPQVTTLFISTKLDERIKSIDLKLEDFFLTNESRKYFEHLSTALKNKQYYQMCYNYYEAKLQEILVKYGFEKINPEKPCSFSCNDLLFINFSIRNIFMNDENKARMAKVAKDERFKDFFHKRTRFEETIYLIESVTEYLKRLNFINPTHPPKVAAVEGKKVKKIATMVVLLFAQKVNQKEKFFDEPLNNQEQYNKFAAAINAKFGFNVKGSTLKKEGSTHESNEHRSKTSDLLKQFGYYDLSTQYQLESKTFRQR